MELTEVQAAADEAVRRHQQHADQETENELALVAAFDKATLYASSDSTVVERDTWPVVNLDGELVAERDQLFKVIAMMMGAEVGVAGAGATAAAGHTKEYRLNGPRTAVEATTVAFRMVETLMRETAEPGEEMQWLNDLFPRLNRRMAVGDITAPTSATDPLHMGPKGVDTGSPLGLRVNATSLLISIGWRVHQREPAAKIAEYVDVAMEDHDVDDFTGQEIVIWADEETKRWLESLDQPPQATAWRRKAEEFAKKMGAGKHRAAAASFARLDLDAPSRNQLARERPVAAAIGATARAAALLTFTSSRDANEKILDMTKRLYPQAWQGRGV